MPIPASEPDFEIVRPASKPRPLIPSMKVDPGPRIERDNAVRPGSVRPRAAEPDVVDEEVRAGCASRDGARRCTSIAPSGTRIAERRVAWVGIDGASALREVHEGERIGPYVVRQIEPAAVLFSEGSVQLRREVGQ